MRRTVSKKIVTSFRVILIVIVIKLIIIIEINTRVISNIAAYRLDNNPICTSRHKFLGRKLF